MSLWTILFVRSELPLAVSLLIGNTMLLDPFNLTLGDGF